MDQPPVDPPPFAPPPLDPPGSCTMRFGPAWVEADVAGPDQTMIDQTLFDQTLIDQTPGDGTSLQPPEVIRRGRHWLPRFLDEAAFQSLRGHLASIGLAVLIAAPGASAVFLGLSALRFALDDRTLWNSVAHSVVQFWYVLVAFVLVAFPAAMVAVRRGWRDAVAFVTGRGYWKVMALAFVVIPALAAIVAFIVGHVVIVLIVLVVLIVMLVHSGGF